MLRPDGDSTKVSVDTDLKISGKLAQFGSGMIKEVSGKLLAQFVTNLEAKLAAEEPSPSPEPVPAEPVSSEPVSAEPVSAEPVSPEPVSSEPASPAPVRSAPLSPALASAGAGAGPPATPAAAPRPDAPAVPDAEPEPLDLLSIAGSSIYKRVLPVAVGVIVVGAVIAWFVARR